MKPGVTGLAQVTFRYGFSQEDSAEKLQYDLFYVKNKSLWPNLVIIIKTIKTVLTSGGSRLQIVRAKCISLKFSALLDPRLRIIFRLIRGIFQCKSESLSNDDWIHH